MPSSTTITTITRSARSETAAYPCRWTGSKSLEPAPGSQTSSFQPGGESCRVQPRSRQSQDRRDQKRQRTLVDGQDRNLWSLRLDHKQVHSNRGVNHAEFNHDHDNHKIGAIRNGSVPL